MVILVTGHLGFIGRNLVRQIPVFRGVDLKSGTDIRDRLKLQKKMSGVDSVVHLAAISGIPECEKDPYQAGSVNVDGSLCVLDAARHEGVETVVLASSCATENPGGMYSRTKLAMEELALAYSKWMNIVILRFTNVYGPYCQDKTSVIANFLRGPINVKGGRQARDFIHVDDVVRMIMYAVSIPKTGIYSVGSGKLTTIDDIAARVSMLTGHEIHREPGNDRTPNPAYIIPAYHDFGWKPKISLEEGLKSTFLWHINVSRASSDV